MLLTYKHKSIYEILLDTLSGNIEDNTPTEIISQCLKHLNINDHHIASNIEKLLKYFLIELKLPVSDLRSYLENKNKNRNSYFHQYTQFEDDGSFDKIFNAHTNFFIDQFELHEDISVERYLNSARYTPTPILAFTKIMDKLV